MEIPSDGQDREGMGLEETGEAHPSRDGAETDVLACTSPTRQLRDLDPSAFELRDGGDVGGNKGRLEDTKNL